MILRQDCSLASIAIPVIRTICDASRIVADYWAETEDYFDYENIQKIPPNVELRI
jgi:hypothetical protein